MPPEVATAPAKTAEGTAAKKDFLTITDNRTGKVYEVPIENGTVKAPDLRKIKTGPDDFGLMTYDPAFMNTASCKRRSRSSTATRGSSSTAATRSSSWPRRPLPRDGLPRPERRAADEGAVRRVGARDHRPHHGPRERHEPHGGLPLRRPPDGHARLLGGGALHLLPRGAQRPRPARTGTADRPPHRQDPDPRGLRIPSLAGQALRLPRQRALVRGQLPPDDVPDEPSRSTSRTPSREGARRALHPPRRPRAELLHLGDERASAPPQVDPYCAAAAAISALYGPLHGGANEAVLRMLKGIGSKAKVPGLRRRTSRRAAAR
jgi:citrate synthase